MKIWVDADACPKAIKDVLFRAAIRTKTLIVLVANQFLPTPSSPFISKIVVLGGFDIADQKIIEECEPGDLVITADIPLADEVITKGGLVLSPRGDIYSSANIKERLSIRNFSTDLRGSGIKTNGPAVMNKRDVQRFANQLDKLLALPRK